MSRTRTELRAQLKAQLQKQELLKRGSVKLLKSQSISKNARKQAQREFNEANEQIRLIEKQLELVGRITETKDEYSLDTDKKTDVSEIRREYISSVLMDDSTKKQEWFDNLIESLRICKINEKCIEITNNIVNIMNDSLMMKSLKLPSMSVMIPIIWPMLMVHNNKLLNACGWKLLRYFVVSYEDVLIVFYFYHKHNHHNRYYHFPYDEYEKLVDLSSTFNDESELLNVYSFQDKYRTSGSNIGSMSSSRTVENGANKNKGASKSGPFSEIPITSILSEHSKLTIETVKENQIKKWLPLVFLIVKTLVEEKGRDVVECIKFIRKTIELKGIRFLSTLTLRVIAIVSESLITTTSLKLTNLQNLSQATLEMIQINISLIECICECIISDPKLSYESNLIKFLVEFLIESPYLINNSQSFTTNNEVLDLIKSFKNISILPIPIILFLLNSSENVKYIKACGFLPMLLSSLLDPVQPSSSNNSVKSQYLSNILNILLCTWNGLGLFLENDCRYLRVLINGLYTENILVRSILMSIISTGLRIKRLSILSNDISKNLNYEISDWEKLYVKSMSFQSSFNSDKSLISAKLFGNFKLNDYKNKLGGRCCPEFEDRIVNQFTFVFLQSCLRCNLPSVLNDLFKKFENDKRATRRIALLLSEMFYLQSMINPRKSIIDMDSLGSTGRLVNDEDIKENYRLKLKMNRLIERESRKRSKLMEKIKIEKHLLTSKLIRKSKTLSNENKNSIMNIFLKSSTIPALYPTIDLNITSYFEQTNATHLLNKLRNIAYDVDIKPLINETRVLTTKEYREWNWPMICVLIKGILWNDHKFEETLKTTKFFKRLVSFYKPEKSGFVQVKYKNEGPDIGFSNDRKEQLDFQNFKDNNNMNINNSGRTTTDFNSAKVMSFSNNLTEEHNNNLMAETYVDVGVALIELLLHQEEGEDILRESRILSTITLSLNKVVNNYYFNNVNSEPANDEHRVEGTNSTANESFEVSKYKNEGLFGYHRMKNTLSWGYLRFVGLLSESAQGVKLMEEVAMIDVIYRIVSLNIKINDINFSKILIEEVDVKKSGMLRLLIEKICIVGNESNKILISKKLIGLLNDINNFNDLDNKEYFIQRWCLSLLNRLRYDYSPVVSELATKILIRFIETEEDVQKFVELNPDLKNNNSKSADGYKKDYELNNTNFKKMTKLTDNGENGIQNVGNGYFDEEQNELMKKIIGYNHGIAFVCLKYSGFVEEIIDKWIDDRFKWVEVKEFLFYKKLRYIEEELFEEEEHNLFERIVGTDIGLEVAVSSGIVEYFIKTLRKYIKKGDGSFESTVANTVAENITDYVQDRENTFSVTISSINLNQKTNKLNMGKNAASEMEEGNSVIESFDGNEDDSGRDQNSHSDHVHQGGFGDEHSRVSYGYNHSGSSNNISLISGSFSETDEEIPCDERTERAAEMEEQISEEDIKCAILGLGMICRTEHGIYKIEEAIEREQEENNGSHDQDNSDIVGMLKKCLYLSKSWSLRGCVLVALGDISLNNFGNEILVENGIETSFDNNNSVGGVISGGIDISEGLLLDPPFVGRAQFGICDITDGTNSETEFPESAILSESVKHMGRLESVLFKVGICGAVGPVSARARSDSSSSSTGKLNVTGTNKSTGKCGALREAFCAELTGFGV